MLGITGHGASKVQCKERREFERKIFLRYEISFRWQDTVARNLYNVHCAIFPSLYHPVNKQVKAGSRRGIPRILPSHIIRCITIATRNACSGALTLFVFYVMHAGPTSEGCGKKNICISKIRITFHQMRQYFIIK
jgi:hypothetical protein